MEITVIILMQITYVKTLGSIHSLNKENHCCENFHTGEITTVAIFAWVVKA